METENRYLNMLDTLPCGVAVFKVGETLECQYFNDAFARLSNRTREELNELLKTGKFLEAVVAPADLVRFSGTIKKDTAAGRDIHITYRFLNKEGETAWLHMNASRLCEEDGSPIYDCVFTSPADEAALYRSIVEDSATGVFVAERKTHRILYRNRTTQRLYHSALDSSVFQNSEPDIIPQGFALLSDEEIASLPSNCYKEYHWQHEDSYYSVRAKTLIWNGIDAYIVYLSDETSEHEKWLRQEELLNQVPVGIGIYEIILGKIHQVYMNDGYYRLVCDTRENREGKQKNFLDLVYPADLDYVQTAVRKCAEGSSLEYINHRILCGDGQYRWFRLAASVVKRDGDRVTLYCGYADIDDAVRAQTQLQDANSKLQKQYLQEMSQREMLEKDSMVAVQFDVTEDKLLSYRVINQNLIKMFDQGTAGTSIRPDIFGAVPTAEEKRIAEDFFSRNKALERYQSGTREFSAEYRRRLNTGCLCWLHCTCRLAKDEDSGDIISYTYVHDIDRERKKELTAESVIGEETDYIILVSTVSDKGTVIRLKKDYQQFSRRLTGDFPFADILAVAELNSAAEEDRKAVNDFFRMETLISRLKKEPMPTVTYRQIDADGNVRRKKTRAFYLDSMHEDIVIASRDITDIYEEEEKQKQTLEAALAAANSANRSKSDFLSRMSHDLRTPMNVIIGSASLAMDSLNDPKETEKSLSYIMNSSRYLLGLINDCLDIEKINSGKVELHPAPYPYSDFYNDIKAVIEPLCKPKNITFIMDDKSKVPLNIVADRMHMEQIFYNLLSNAVKFTRPGGTVEMLTRNINVQDGHATFDTFVRDNGIGMSEEFQKQMFEPFTQEENDMTPEYQGTGLGLAIVRQLTDMIGAEMEVKSTLGKGTEFKIHFQVPVAPEKEAIKEEKEMPALEETLRGKHVLLADDHPLNRMIAQKLLEKEGIMVTEAENGKEALERFQSVSENFFDAVLMDIRMPVMNGLEAAKAIRALDRPDAKTVPIIAMTANAFDTDVEESLRAGMTAHLSKPIEPQKLYETLAELIHRQK